MLRTAAFFVALLIPSVAAARVDSINSSPRVPYVIASVDYTQVVDTMTKTAGNGNFTVFSTITIPSNTLSRNGDAIMLYCAGTMYPGPQEVRTIVGKIGSVVISSRTTTGGVPTLTIPWNFYVRLIKTSTGNQLRLCEASLTIGHCALSAPSPAIGSGVNTIDETQPMVFTCSADNVTAGATAFLQSDVTFIPAP